MLDLDHGLGFKGVRDAGVCDFVLGRLGCHWVLGHNLVASGHAVRENTMFEHYYDGSMDDTSDAGYNYENPCLDGGYVGAEDPDPDVCRCGGHGPIMTPEGAWYECPYHGARGLDLEQIQPGEYEG